MLMLAYSVLLALAMAAWTLRHLIPMLRANRLPTHLPERFGRIPPTLAAPSPGQRTVWLHANSVGEILSASRLLHDLEAALGAGWTVYLSTATTTGLHLAQQRLDPSRVFTLPFDYAFSLRPYLRHLRPAIVVLIEGDVWPRMAYECRKGGIPVVVVNARIDDRSIHRPGIIRWMWSRRFRPATLWLAQGETDVQRLIELDAPAGAVRFGGNLKYDVPAVARSRIVDLIRQAARGRPILVAGSTKPSTQWDVDDEEAQVVHAWMKAALPLNALLVLAPRHPERFADAWAIARDFPAARATELLTAETLPDVDIILLDTIGDLASVYSIATVAFIGGSLFPHGGHNPLEPAQFAVPVVMGSSFENFREIVRGMQAADAIRIVHDEAGLEQTFAYLLTHPVEAQAQGLRGQVVCEHHRGATQRAIDAIQELL
jgi:3-deoxy-D-manno-octulosonic-acid transferase